MLCSATADLSQKSRPSAATKFRYRKQILPFYFKAPFTISNNAFHTREWSNLARGDVSRQRLTPPLVSFFFIGWLIFLAAPDGCGVGAP
jgi:hypothetical protein